VNNFEQSLLSLSRLETISIDTETTGLRWYKNDSAFSIILGDEQNQFYYKLSDLTDDQLEQLKLFLRSSKTWITQNGKYDMHILAKLGVELGGKIVDNWFLERVHNNRHASYSMANMSKRWGYEKSGDVIEYCNEHGLKKVVTDPLLGKEITEYQFDKVPDSILIPYALNDVRVTHGCYLKISSAIKSEEEFLPKKAKDTSDLLENESRLIRTVWRMEQRGVLVDWEYCNEGRKHYEEKVRDAESKFKDFTGRDFSKGPTLFKDLFGDEIEKWTYTAKGNPEFDIGALKRFENPAAKIVIEYSQAKKQLEYFQNFLWYSDSDSVIHCDYKQAGTDTTRFSCSDPNLQNLTKPDKYEKVVENDPFPVRRALIPRPGFFFAALDFDQVEYRVMLDIANADALILKIIEGLDVHAATAFLSGTSRQQAKTTNFLSLYGGGIAKLANDLFGLTISHEDAKALWKLECGWRLDNKERELVSKLPADKKAHNLPLLHKAKGVQDAIFAAAPELKVFTKAVIESAKNRGYIFNFFGRRYQFPDKKFAYKAPNHLIQGSCADAMKIAMNRIDELLLDYKTKMILTIHDELVLEVFYGEEFLIPQVKAIMEKAYPWKKLPTKVSVEWSNKSLADKEDWIDA